MNSRNNIHTLGEIVRNAKNLFGAEESSKITKAFVTIAREGSYQCSNTENSDSASLTKGVIICAAPARAGRQAGQPACNGISGLSTNPHKTCGAFTWQAGWPGEAGSRLEAPGIPARRARKSTYKQTSPGQSCIIMVSTLR